MRDLRHANGRRGLDVPPTPDTRAERVPAADASSARAREAALIAAALAGDERAFRSLVEPYRRELEVHCYRMLGSPHDAEDLVQETLLRVWRTLERFSGRSSMRTWLYKVANNACLDELERRPRRPLPSSALDHDRPLGELTWARPYPDARLDEAANPLADPAARYAEREGMELAFLAAIQHLPGRQRAILILRDVLGWSASEAAELLDSTVAAVNSALQRARATIERHYQPTPNESPDSAAADDEQRDLSRRYVSALEAADMKQLVALLKDDAVMRMPPVPGTFVGQSVIRDFLADRCIDGDLGRIELVPTRANRRPAFALYMRERDDVRRSHGIVVATIDGEEITALDAFIDPALAAVFDLPMTLGA